MSLTRPNFLVLGPHKAGADLVAQKLRTHRQVFMPENSEGMFFNKPTCEKPEEIAAYLSQFSMATEAHACVGEMTTGYFWTAAERYFADQPPASHNPQIPQSVMQVLGPEISLIVSLAHPVRRALSSYMHHGAKGRIPSGKSLRDMAPRLGILDIGFYDRHLRAWEAVYDPAQIEVLICEEELVRQPWKGVHRLASFLNIDRGGFGPSSYDPPAQNKQPDLLGTELITGLRGLEPVLPQDIAYLLEQYTETLKVMERRFGDRIRPWQEETRRLHDFASQNAARPPRRKGRVLKVGVFNHKNLRSHGWDCNPETVPRHGSGLTIEPPARSSMTILRGHCSLGAFSYTVDGTIYTTDIGRYCSIAKGINIGQTDHPFNFLSTSPTHFQGSFKIATGDQFPHKHHYDADRPSPEISRAATSLVKRRTKIGNDVWIGFGATVIAGITICDGAVIGAGAVVTKDVAPYAIVAGTPAREIRKRFDDDIIARLLETAWWDYAPWQMRHIDFSDIRAAVDAVEKMRRKEIPGYWPDLLKTT